MARDASWVPPDIDRTLPSSARIYDYFLDGAHNFAVDREMADKIDKVVPGRDASRVARAFLRRAVRFMVDSGIRQFLDLGSGIPTVGNVHEIAQQVDPECRTVYVDKEAVAVAHSELLLQDNDRAAVIKANLRDVEYILNHQTTTRLLDFDQPIGLLMVSVLHFVPDSWDPVGIVARYQNRLTAGSYLAVSHITADSDYPGMDAFLAIYQNTPEPVCARTHAEVLRFFSGFALVEPGLVGIAHWRPSGPGDTSDHAGINTISYAGVGRKL